MIRKIFIALFLLISTVGLGQIEKELPAKPNPPKLVVDYTGTLAQDQQDALERKVVSFDDSTSVQIAIGYNHPGSVQISDTITISDQTKWPEHCIIKVWAEISHGERNHLATGPKNQSNNMTIIQLTESKQAQEVLDIIRAATQGSEYQGLLYMAGGYVRDTLLGQDSKDSGRPA